MLRGAAERLAKATGLNPGWAFALVVLLVLALVVAGAYSFGATVVGQVNSLVADLPKSTEEARSRLREYDWGRELLDRAPPLQSLLGRAGDAATIAAGFFTTTFGVLGNLLVLSVLALYLGASPGTYVDGVVTLVPVRHRARAREVLSAVGTNLQGWLVGRLIAVVAVGLIVTAGLWFAGVPQYLVLGLVAALFSIVPFVGPLLGAAPGLVLALTQSPATAGWALGVYVLAQLVENYLITPLVQQRTVNMPPVLTIAAITLVGAVTGVLGLIVATPLAVALKVLVQMLYVEDVLGDDQAVGGARRAL